MTERSYSHSVPREVMKNRYSGIRVKSFLFVGQLGEKALKLKHLLSRRTPCCSEDSTNKCSLQQRLHAEKREFTVY